MAAVLEAGPVRPGLRATVRKYWNIFRASLVERLTYRGDFFLATVLRFLPVATTILLWEAVYDQREGKPIGEEGAIVFTRNEMVAYLLLIHISRMFSSMPGLAGGISRDIREGTLKKYLVQPLDMIGYLLSYRLAHKAAYIATSSFPYLGLFLVCSSYFDSLPDASMIPGYLVALLLGFLVGFFFESCIGMAGFWFLEVTSLLWVVTTISYFVSGQMFPLDILGPNWRAALKLLPFQYLAYFPAMVFLGKISGALVEGLLIESVWVVVLIVLARYLYARGLRRYSAFGG